MRTISGGLSCARKWLAPSCFFRYPDGADALYVANHNAYASQAMVIEIKDKSLKLDVFDRQTGAWKELKPEQVTIRFKLPAAGGELVFVQGGKLP